MTHASKIEYRRLAGRALMRLALVALAASGHASTWAQDGPVQAEDFSVTSYSGPIVLSADKNHIWVVNPDNDTVSVIGKLDGTAQVLDEFLVGREPCGSVWRHEQCRPQRVSRLRCQRSRQRDFDHHRDGQFGELAERGGDDAAADWRGAVGHRGDAGRAAGFVANSGQDDDRDPHRHAGGSSRCQPAKRRVNGGDPGLHFQPRGMAVTLNSDRLYVTLFLDSPRRTACRRRTGAGRAWSKTNRAENRHNNDRSRPSRAPVRRLHAVRLGE